MKKFGIVLLSLGLIAVFSMSAFATDLKMSGNVQTRGSYFSSPTMLNPDLGSGRAPYSFWDERFRTYWNLHVVDGLDATVRMDIQENTWGSSNTTGADNIAFEEAYVTFKTGIGTISSGYQGYHTTNWGTKFLDTTGTTPGLKYVNQLGPVTLTADWTIKRQLPDTGVAGVTTTDSNYNVYELSAEGKFPGGQAGLLYQYSGDATGRGDDVAESSRFLRTLHTITPYAQAKFGPVNVEAEAYYMTGDWKKYESSVTQNNTTVRDMKAESYGGYVNGKFNIGPAWVGGMLIYMSGDDPNTTDKVEGGIQGGYLKNAKDNQIWGNFTSIVFLDDYHDRVLTRGNSNTRAVEGAPSSSSGTTKYMDNVYIEQVYGGVKPMKNLSLDARFSFMQADKVVNGGDKDYGRELDVKATYNIFDNLSYNIGAAYLWTGDFFKGDTNGTAASHPAGTFYADVANVYYLSHWLYLTF